MLKKLDDLKQKRDRAQITLSAIENEINNLKCPGCGKEIENDDIILILEKQGKCFNCLWKLKKVNSCYKCIHADLYYDIWKCMFHAGSLPCDKDEIDPERVVCDNFEART